MGIHTSAWFGEIDTKRTVVRTFEKLTAAPDQILGVGSNNLIPSKTVQLAAAAALGFLDDLAGSIGRLREARLQTPRTLVSPVYVRPVNADLPAAFGDNPNVSNFSSNPVLMRADEEISASALGAATGLADVDDVLVGLIAWFWDRQEPVPVGESYWVAFTATADLVEKKWSPGTFSFLDQTTLPKGRYAIRGMHLYPQTLGTPSGLCGRLVIPNEVMRPGALVLPAASSRTPPLESDGSLGVWARFSAQQPLSMEFFSLTTQASVAYNGFLFVVPQEG